MPGTATRPVSNGPGNTVSGDTIKIGIIASQNGELSPWGIDSINGAKLAVKEANEAGGVNGKKIELIVGDSNSKPEFGKSAAEKLISQDKVVALLGEVASGITAQVALTAFEKGVPLVSVGATRTDITQTGSNIYRVCYTDDFQGAVMARFAYDQLNLRNIAMMTDNKQPYSTGLSASFRKRFTELGGTIVDEQFYESGQTQFQGQLSNIKAKNPDGMFLSGYFNEVGPIARQTKEIGLNVKLLGGDGWDSAQILTSGGAGIVGGYFCNHYSEKEDRPVVHDFLAKWKAEYKTPAPGTTMGALGYDAAKLMIDALKRGGMLTSLEINQALAQTENLEGVTGTLTLKGQDGNPPKRALVVELTAQGPVPVKSYTKDEVY